MLTIVLLLGRFQQGGNLGFPSGTDGLQLITRMCFRIFAIPIVASLAWCQSLDHAKRAFDNGDYDVAARLFEQAHQASPNCEILFFLGVARYRLKEPDTALIAFRSAVECDPKLLP